LPKEGRRRWVRPCVLTPSSATLRVHRPPRAPECYRLLATLVQPPPRAQPACQSYRLSAKVSGRRCGEIRPRPFPASFPNRGAATMIVGIATATPRAERDARSALSRANGGQRAGAVHESVHRGQPAERGSDRDQRQLGAAAKRGRSPASAGPAISKKISANP